MIDTSDSGSGFTDLARRGVEEFSRELRSLDLPLHVESFTDARPAGSAGSFDPLDALELALAEKLERRYNFLLVLSDSEMSTTRLSFALAYPSRLTNIGLISTRRLLPRYADSDLDVQGAARRLGTLMLHSMGHLLNLGHSQSPAAAMYDFASIEDLDRMYGFDGEEREAVARNLPVEAHDETNRGSSITFWWRQVMANIPSITGTLKRAHPFRLLAKLPTLLTAALSVAVVLFFSSEVWDVAEAVEIYQIVIFVVIAYLASTIALYRTFGFRTLLDRERLVSESTVVTQAATALAISATLLVAFALFFAIAYLAAVTIFPRQLMAEWTSIDPATEPIDHVKLSLFLASMAILTGSLGGRGDSQQVIRTILFLDEET